MTSLLPAEFSELEPFAATWCLATEGERYALRLATPMAELVAFHDAFAPRLEEAIDHCDRFPLDDLPDDVLHLLQLIHSMINVSMAVEIMFQPKTVDSADAVLVRVREPLP